MTSILPRSKAAKNNEAALLVGRPSGVGCDRSHDDPRRGFGSRPPAPVTIEDVGAVSCPWAIPSQQRIFVSSDDISSDDANQSLKLSEPSG